MKTFFKPVITISIILFSFFFSGCEKELYDEAIHQNHQVTQEKVSFNELMAVINDPTIKSYLSSIRQDISTNLGNNKLSDEELLYFQKFVKENAYTSYSLRLNDFSLEKPYYLDLVIKTDSITEKAGFIKYIPDEVTPAFDARSFTGRIEISNLKDHVVASNLVVNGIAVNAASIAASECFSTIELIQHNCTHGGNHAPGEACEGPGGNDGYYEIVITNFCLTFPEDLNFIAAPNASLGSNTGGGFVPLTQAEMAFNHFINNFLTDEQAGVLGTNPQLRDYLMANNVSEESKLIVLKMIDYILQNDRSPESVLFVLQSLDAVNQYYDEFGENPETKEIADNFLYSLFEEEGENIDDVVLLTPPDCNSFNFTSPSATINWQQSAVINIHFTVLVGTPNGVFVNHVIEYPGPILFGMPKTLTVGNTPISPGLAATLSAAALNNAIKETIKKYGNKSVSFLIVEQYFESRLKHNFEIGIPGARLNLHPPSYPTPTQYQTNASGLGDCQ